jgi:putative addiction module CopG family antidote
MEVNLPADQQAMIESLVASGRFPTTGDAISEGVRLLASTEKLRQQVQVGIEQADRGDVVDHDTVFSRLKAISSHSCELKRSDDSPASAVLRAASCPAP